LVNISEHTKLGSGNLGRGLNIQMKCEIFSCKMLCNTSCFGAYIVSASATALFMCSVRNKNRSYRPTRYPFSVNICWWK